MKLNFLNVLNKQSSPDEIAQEIVVLEAKEREATKEHDSLKDAAKELRTRRLCGENVSDDQIKVADRKCESASLDIEAIKEMIGNLTNKLHAGFEEIKIKGLPGSQEKRSALILEHQRVSDEIVKVQARLVVLAETYHGVGADTFGRTGRLFWVSPDAESSYYAELDRCRAQIKHPTYYDRKVEADNYARWISEMSIDDEVRQVLDKYRGAMTKPLAV